MTTLMQRLGLQLPEWARPEHPHLRFELKSVAQLPRRRRLLRALGFALVVVVLYVGGYLQATDFLQSYNPFTSWDASDPLRTLFPGQNLTEGLMMVWFWPTLILQALAAVLALAMTVNTVSEQKRRQTWDNLRATEGGVKLGFRTRWATVFYRLRPLLIAIFAIRILLIAGILYDLTAFQGRYIDLLLNGVTPDIPPILAALLLAFLMTAGLLLPLTAIGFEAALGLWLSVTFQQRIYSVMAQLIVIALRLSIIIGLVVAARGYMDGAFPTLPDGAAWGLMATFGALGDWALNYLHLGYYASVWATIPYTIFLGIALLIFTLAQSALTEWILNRAIRRAERVG
ncbi:MAG TPA: hypothetical protein PLQ56_08315 [Aggregatilineales bacterium]|nr:hypothetical protein [Anaerolineae bacterium]HUN06591.1 hypothetical protein [Aggregatilineales bacterium]